MTLVGIADWIIRQIYAANAGLRDTVLESEVFMSRLIGASGTFLIQEDDDSGLECRGGHNVCNALDELLRMIGSDDEHAVEVSRSFEGRKPFGRVARPGITDIGFGHAVFEGGRELREVGGVEIESLQSSERQSEIYPDGGDERFRFFHSLLSECAKFVVELNDIATARDLPGDFVDPSTADHVAGELKK